MLEKLSNFLISIMEKDDAIDPEIKEAYAYGLQIMIINIVGILLSLVIGVLMSAILETIVFLLLFITTRRFTGGYHANSFCKCALTTGSVVLITLFLSKHILLPVGICILISLVSFLIFVNYAPVENENKPLTSELKRKCKWISIFLLIIECSTGFILFICQLRVYNTVFITIIFVSLLVLISVYEERRKTNEKSIQSDC